MAMSQWRTVPQNLGGVLYVQVIPINDTREHSEEVGACWCGITNDEDDPFVLVHHAADGREAFETGERKAS